VTDSGPAPYASSRPAATFAFDVYGTLVDTSGLVGRLEEMAGSKAEAVSALWRSKQLEYSFRRAAMGSGGDFRVCTRDALAFALETFGVARDGVFEAALLGAYRRLPAYPDAARGVRALKAKGHRVFAFSNGRREDVEELMAHAGIRETLDGVVSVEEVGSFKPDPRVYGGFLARAGSTAATTWLVSSNPFDVLGALACGWRAAWVKRSPGAVFDPWGPEPTRVVVDLEALADSVLELVPHSEAPPESGRIRAS